ncbi:cellulose biosynthesis protein BcsQ [Borreliella afzelii]|uniref:Cellulose biosynthesis protein BcsQ n=1 Tax=Borreliella afzelii TaxID=29518 RepID=A0AB34Z3M9_BORAF|nr:cellulose biosynthesis protein BcsQ [Borreliella afzelii]
MRGLSINGSKKKPIIITLASLKGGGEKSSLSIIFSYILKELGKKVLLIVLDPQNSLTSYFN